MSLKSRMMGDYHVRFCERGEAQFLAPTRPDNRFTLFLWMMDYKSYYSGFRIANPKKRELASAFLLLK
jgi:hypothetical protein